MKPKKKKYRRSDTKIETQEGRLLAYLRESRNLSMRKAGEMIGYSSATVNHAENGRMDLGHDLILRFLNAYGYTPNSSLTFFFSFQSPKLQQYFLLP